MVAFFLLCILLVVIKTQIPIAVHLSPSFSDLLEATFRKIRKTDRLDRDEKMRGMFTSSLPNNTGLAHAQLFTSFIYLFFKRPLLFCEHMRPIYPLRARVIL